jgi:hypothetical protein
MKKIRLHIERKVSNPRNSTCGSARLCDLDWSAWFTDGGIVTAWSGSKHQMYLHVRRRLPELDGSDETWHRVYPRIPKGAGPGVRLALKDGELRWLIDCR